MKLVLCADCHTITPATGEPMEFNRCKCNKSAICYTGTENEVAVAGPVVVLGIDDQQWLDLQRGNIGNRRVMATFITVALNASTVIDLGLDGEGERPPLNPLPPGYKLTPSTYVNNYSGIPVEVIDREAGHVTFQMGDDTVTISEINFNSRYHKP